MSPETQEAAYARLKAVSDSLGEVFDSVHIVVTLQEGDESSVITAGSGSFYARWASMRELVLQWDEYAREEARSAVIIGDVEGPDEAPSEP